MLKRIHYLPAFLLFACTASAEVQPIAIRLTGGTVATERYTVPADKVLLIEKVKHVTSPAQGVLKLFTYQLFLNDDGSTGLPQSSTLDSSYSSGELFSFGTPFRIEAGSYVSLPICSGCTVNDYYVYGLLVDTSDLYARAIGSQFQEVALLGSDSLRARLQLSSPRPARIRVEESMDLENWVDSPLALVIGTAHPRTKELQTGSDSSSKLYRAKVTARH